MSDHCDKIQNRLTKLHLIQSPITDDPEIQAHLANCPACRRYHQSLNQDHKVLEDYAESLEVYVEQVKAKLHQEITHPTSPSSKSVLYPWLAVAAVIGLVLTLTLVLQRGHLPEAPSPQSVVKSPTPATSDPAPSVVETELVRARQSFEQKDVVTLAQLLDSDHATTRVQAARYLGQIGDQTVVTRLQRLTQVWDSAEVENPYAQAITQIEQRLAQSVAPETQPVATAESQGQHINPNATGVRLEVLVTDQQTGQPLPGVLIKSWTWTLDSGRASGRTDAHGLCKIGFDEGTVPEIELKVIQSGYAIRKTDLKNLLEQDSPYHIDIELEPGTVIGGRVYDSNGLPLQDVTIHASSDPDTFADQEIYSPIDFEVKTDERGWWSYEQMPSEIRELYLGFSHPNYARAVRYAVNPRAVSPDLSVLVALRDQSYEVTLDTGIFITGRVVDANGAPVSGAEVQCYYDSAVLTDSEGRYRIDHLEPDISSVQITVKAEDYPPVSKYKAFMNSNRREPIDIVLQKGRSIAGWIVDSNDAPIEGARVAAMFEVDLGLPGWSVVTDVNGFYALDSIPSGQVEVLITHPDYMLCSCYFTDNETSVRTVLYSPVRVTVTVRDAQSQVAMSSYKMITGDYYSSADFIRWNHETLSVPIVEGQAECTFTELEEGYALMVEADGYQPATSRVIEPGEAHVQLDFELQKSEPLTGTVLSPEGDSRPDVQVYLCPSIMVLGVRDGVPTQDSKVPWVRTDIQGQFTVDSSKWIEYLVAIGEEGIGQISYQEFREQGVLILEPWVTVAGTLYVDGEPAVEHMLEIRTRDELEDRGAYFSYSEANTDIHGRFEFDHIPPGHMILYHREYEVQAGQTYEMQLGLPGQTVTGHFPLADYHQQGPLTVPGKLISLDDQSDRIGLKYTTYQQIDCDSTGRFLASHLWPGRYALAGAWIEAGSKHLFRFWREFELPEASSDVPLDLGVIELLPGDLEVGDAAPDFNLLDVDMNAQRLTGLSGKLVLLSFYRDDDVQRPNPKLLELEELYEQYGQVDAFTMIGMFSSAQSSEQVQALVEATGFTWPYVHVGRTELNRMHIEYDILRQPWPWNILIGPDGTILAMGLHGQELKEEIEGNMPY